MDDGLYSFGNVYCTVWCRTTEHSSYRNVYAVFISHTGEDWVIRSHRVVSSLSNGAGFAGFLIKSLLRPNSLALISSKGGVVDETVPLRGHWVIVESTSESDAMLHEDVRAIKEHIENPPSESFCGVYFISNGNGAVKIGQTTTSLRTRLAQLQAASPYKLYVCASITIESRKALERQLHGEFAARRMHGEWFSMTDDEAVAIAERHGGQEVFVGREKRRSTAAC